VGGCGADSSTVVENPVAAVVVSPSSVFIAVGADQQFSATLKDGNGTVLTGRGITWSSSKTGVATVDANGMAHGVSGGTAEIVATSESKADTASLTVQAVFGNVVNVDASTTYQVMSGWEATAQAGQDAPSFGSFKDELYDRAANELGINRIRLPVRAGVENAQDFWTQFQGGQIDNATWRCVRYSTVNDNSDPNQTNAAGYHFSEIDHLIQTVVLPMRQRLQANGEQLYVNLNYTAFTSQICSGYQYIHTNPDEYAEFVLATFQHIDQTFGFVPDALELILEPDLTLWNGSQIGSAMVASESKLSSNGYHPDFIAPSTTDMSNASPYFDAMMGVTGASQVITTLSYHRYSGVSDASLQNIASRTEQYGIRSAMLEHVGSGYLDLYKDLTEGRVSSWQQFTLGFPTTDNGAQYYWIDGSNNVQLGSRTRFLRQYFRWVRLGAQRIGASSNKSGLDPVAFINTDGSYVVVAKSNVGVDMSITGLPAGTYGINYTTGSAFDVDETDVTIGSGQSLPVRLPDAGVITIYGK
jgi:hypothetical protein